LSEQLVERDRKVANAFAASIVNGISDSRTDAGHTGRKPAGHNGLNPPPMGNLARLARALGIIHHAEVAAGS
jgi:hypothetical protein